MKLRQTFRDTRRIHNRAAQQNSAATYHQNRLALKENSFNKTIVSHTTRFFGNFEHCKKQYFLSSNSSFDYGCNRKKSIAVSYEHFKRKSSFNYDFNYYHTNNHKNSSDHDPENQPSFPITLHVTQSTKYKVLYLIGALVLLILIYLLIDNQNKKSRNKDFKKFQRMFNLLQSGEINSFAVHFIELAEQTPKLIKAIELVDAEKFDEAISLFDEVFTHEFKLKAPYYLVRGIIHASLRQTSQALQWFDLALKSTPNELNEFKACVYYHKSLALDNLLHFEEAKQNLELAKSLSDEIKKFDNSIYFKIRKVLGYLADIEPIKNKSLGYDPANRVSIKIWKPLSEFTEKDSLGHVSVETNRSYLSFYPAASDKENEFKEIFRKRNPKHYTFWDDLKANNRFPDEKISLYSLNVDEIDQFITAFQMNPNISWVLKGSTIIRGTNEHNCTSVAYEALAKGGIAKLANRFVEDVKPATSTGITKGATLGALTGFLALSSIIMGYKLNDGTLKPPNDIYYPNTLDSILYFFKLPSASNTLKESLKIINWLGENGGYIGAPVGGVIGTSLGFGIAVQIAALLSTPESIARLAHKAQEVEKEQALKPR